MPFSILFPFFFSKTNKLCSWLSRDVQLGSDKLICGPVESRVWLEAQMLREGLLRRLLPAFCPPCPQERAGVLWESGVITRQQGAGQRPHQITSSRVLTFLILLFAWFLVCFLLQQRAACSSVRNPHRPSHQGKSVSERVPVHVLQVRNRAEAVSPHAPPRDQGVCLTTCN